VELVAARLDPDRDPRVQVPALSTVGSLLAPPRTAPQRPARLKSGLSPSSPCGCMQVDLGKLANEVILAIRTEKQVQ
jgi:hypothetical protein